MICSVSDFKTCRNFRKFPDFGRNPKIDAVTLIFLIINENALEDISNEPSVKLYYLI